MGILLRSPLLRCATDRWLIESVGNEESLAGPGTSGARSFPIGYSRRSRSRPVSVSLPPRRGGAKLDPGGALQRLGPGYQAHCGPDWAAVESGTGPKTGTLILEGRSGSVGTECESSVPSARPSRWRVELLGAAQRSTLARERRRGRWPIPRLGTAFLVVSEEEVPREAMTSVDHELTV